MTTMLLSETGNVILAVAIFSLITAFAILVASNLNKKITASQNASKGGKLEGKVKVVLNKPYMKAEAFQFYNALQLALPLEYTAFPNVGVDNLVKPAGDLIAYKAIAGKYIDFVVFKKDGMEPVAVIDLIDPGVSLNSIMQQDPVITKTLKAINIPVLEFKVEDNYNEKEILARFLDSQDPYTLAMLKKGMERRKYDRYYTGEEN